MVKQETLQVKGKVIEKMPNAMFRIRFENNHEIIATLSGKMRKNYIRILPGDEVDVEISSYDLGRGRIIYRTK